MVDLPNTRRAARDANVPLYFTGKPCKHGHVEPRYMTNGTCVVCMKQISSEAFKRDPEKVKRSRASDPDAKAKTAARMRRWRKSHPERARAAYKRVRENHRDKTIARTRSWKERNRDHVRAYGRKIAEVKNHARRARKMSAEGRYTHDDIALLLTQQFGLCVGCKRDISKRYTIDHKTPLIRGGSNWPHNLQLLCRPCNSLKGTRTMDEWLAS